MRLMMKRRPAPGRSASSMPPIVHQVARPVDSLRPAGSREGIACRASSAECGRGWGDKSAPGVRRRREERRQGGL